ncbi:hypothetical protein [Pseudarthrobacter sulfonivorans]|uniref:hypothetical protein n=1 Tax=Pseudarthrobacter sulfonivorans TaxID=121292 RepID=UPI002107D6ED|nr:hypothetical protein [Pseudarthrobacter sulfonivorans]
MSKSNLVRSAGAAVAALGLCLTGSAQAFAEGARVEKINFNDGSCSMTNGFEFCSTFQGTLNGVFAPNGLVNFTMDVTNTFRVTAPDGTVRSHDERVHQKYLIKDGATHVSLYQQSVVDDFGPFTCTLDVHSHLVDGAVQFDRGESICTVD